MYSEINFDEIAEIMELDNDIELKHRWKHFYDTLHVFGLKIFKESEDVVSGQGIVDMPPVKLQDSIFEKIKQEIESKYENCDICEFFEDYDYEENDISEYRSIGSITDILEIIDRYNAESEGE